MMDYPLILKKKRPAHWTFETMNQITQTAVNISSSKQLRRSRYLTYKTCIRGWPGVHEKTGGSHIHGSTFITRSQRRNASGRPLSFYLAPLLYVVKSPIDCRIYTINNPLENVYLQYNAKKNLRRHENCQNHQLCCKVMHHFSC